MQFHLVQAEGLNLDDFQILEVSSRWSRSAPSQPGAIRIDPCFVEAEHDTSRYFPHYRDHRDALLNPKLAHSLSTLGLKRGRPTLVSSPGAWGPVNGGRVVWALCSSQFSDVYWINGAGSKHEAGGTAPLECLAGADGLKGALLVDLRSRAEYLGQREDRYRFFRSRGHIPGALWLGDWTSLVRADRRLRDREELRRRWQRAGLTADRDVVFYCGTGWRSSLACCVALWLGYSRVRNYDGGIYDWVSRGLPLSEGETTASCGTSWHMKRLAIAALCCLSAAAQPPQVYEGKYLEYRYPQLRGLASPDLQDKINRQLRGIFWPPQHPTGYREMRGYKIGRLDSDYISVRYTGGGIADKAGSHNRVGTGLTLNLHTGQPLRLQDLFRSGSDWMTPLEKLARPVVEKEMGIPFPDDFGKRPFGFYLTPKKLVLFDLYSGHPPWDYPVSLEALREVLK